jgi:hypothetical protein
MIEKNNNPIDAKRKEEIKKEALRRLNLWLTYSSYDEMSAGGSVMRFNMSLGLLDYPFKKEKWMVDKGFNKFVSEKEFDSPDYDEIILEIKENAEDGLNSDIGKE